jgi:putative tricarboxylic transport membrane protein
MFALGIPGGGATAILLAAFAMHNIIGGPQFIAQNKDIVYAIIFGNFVQAIALLFVGVVFVYFAASIVRVPLRFLIPSVLAVSTFGSYAITNSLAGPITLYVFALIGWAMLRYDYPVAATVVGLLLGSLLEQNLIRTLQISRGDFAYLLDRPGAMLIVAIMVLSLGLTSVNNFRRARKARREGLQALGAPGAARP